VHWGLIVLIWYPLANYFIDQAMYRAAIGLGIGSVVFGILLSTVRGTRLQHRLPGDNTFITRQIFKVFIGCIGGGMVLSAVAPATEWVHGENVPILWGLIYANLAFMLGVIYNRDFVIAGAFIFAGSIVAMFLPHIQGYILGPVMGFGMIVPGMRAEARLKSLLQVSGDEATA
jgi:hypothetical protein